MSTVNCWNKTVCTAIRFIWWIA